MASYQVLYWQDIPSQVKAWDDFDEISLPLFKLAGIPR